MVKLGGRCAERAGYERRITVLESRNRIKREVNVVTFRRLDLCDVSVELDLIAGN
jgi:hypothetical protein